MHLKKYLHRNHFTLRTYHKLLEWLVSMSDAHGKKGRWINILQDFNFKILHRPKLKHTNVDFLSRNPVGQATDDDDFSEKIQDIESVQVNTPETKENIFSIQIGEDSDWFGFKRQARKLAQHHRCCFGINH